MTPEEAKRIKEKTGFEISGYEYVIGSESMRHINKGHGASRGSLAVTSEDIKRIPEIVSNLDDVERSVTNRGEPSIKYKKRFSNVICYLEVVSKGNKRPVAKTTYKEKAGGPRADSG